MQGCQIARRCEQDGRRSSDSGDMLGMGGGRGGGSGGSDDLGGQGDDSGIKGASPCKGTGAGRGCFEPCDEPPSSAQGDAFACAKHWGKRTFRFQSW